MSAPNPDENKRNYWPPPSWSAVQKKAVPPPQDPPIVGHVTLPEKVSIRYLAEITGQELSTIIDDLRRLRLYLGDNRSLDFENAAKLLQKYGIAANKEA